jgi:uncharacterized membrane protein
MFLRDLPRGGVMTTAIPPSPHCGRLFLGGLLGGLLSNVSGIALGALVLQADASRFLDAMENPPSGTKMFVEHVLMRFGIGLAAAWLYWAIRPRFEARTRAIVASATFLWVTTYVFSALLLEELRVYSTLSAVIGTAWGYVELVLVVVTIAWVLREPAARR